MWPSDKDIRAGAESRNFVQCPVVVRETASTNRRAPHVRHDRQPPWRVRPSQTLGVADRIRGKWNEYAHSHIAHNIPDSSSIGRAPELDRNRDAC